MPRCRDNDLLAVISELLLDMPIWVGPILAGVVYVLLRFAWPAMVG